MKLNWGRAALIGDTGFVGSTLARQVAFAKTYNSRTIERVAGERFDTLVCAGAPATMWAANADPQADSNNLRRLASAIDSAVVDRLILISTIAVFDDAAAGYTETDARYETIRAYGRNRRDLELHLLAHHNPIVMRLPALFGPGLKKNFIFDIINLIPSFMKREKFMQTHTAFTSDERRLADQVFAFDVGLSMQKLDRAALEACGGRSDLERAFERVGFLARDFTNSESQYQYYNLANLKQDIETSASHDLTITNVCSEPWRVGDLHNALVGSAFTNTGPPVIREDVHTEHAGAFGRSGPYLYDRSAILLDLIGFVRGGDC